MNILLLGPPRTKIENHIRSFGDKIINVQDRLSEDSRHLGEVGFIVSYGYRYIISGEIIKLFPDKVINLHISFLPWNRGADPNLWSYLDDTPKGVTIHLMDEGIDTGPILVQKKVDDKPSDTLKTSYDRLSNCIEELFLESWVKIRNGEIAAKPQVEEGTYHRLKDKERYAHLLTEGWDTPVKILIGRAKKYQGVKK